MSDSTEAPTPEALEQLKYYENWAQTSGFTIVKTMPDGFNGVVAYLRKDLQGPKEVHLVLRANRDDYHDAYFIDTTEDMSCVGHVELALEGALDLLTEFLNRGST